MEGTQGQREVRDKTRGREGFDEKAALAERLEEVKREISWWNSIPDGGRSKRRHSESALDLGAGGKAVTLDHRERLWWSEQRGR